MTADRYRRGGLVSGPMIRDDEVPAILSPGGPLANDGVCIGGPLDRQIASRPLGEHRMEVVGPGGTRHWYNHSSIAGDTKTFGVWVHADMTGDELMERLLRYYREGR